jgi:hypothetical protein
MFYVDLMLVRRTTALRQSEEKASSVVENPMWNDV